MTAACATRRHVFAHFPHPARAHFRRIHPRRTGDHPIEIGRIALDFGQRLPPAARTADEKPLPRGPAVPCRQQRLPEFGHAVIGAPGIIGGAFGGAEQPVRVAGLVATVVGHRRIAARGTAHEF
jgi:hypothetical protein